MDHTASRQQMYATVPDFWADLNGTEYALYDYAVIHPDLVREVREATEKVSRLLTAFTNRMQRLSDDDWLQLIRGLGYPEASAQWLRLNNLPWASMIARADWALTPEGPKLLEWNADTPSFIKELFEVNGVVCRHFQVSCPNESLDLELQHALAEAVHTAARWLGASLDHVRITVSGYPDDEEDTATNRYLIRLLRNSGLTVEEVPLQALSADRNGLYNAAGDPVQIWFRPGYPLEFLAEEADPFSGIALGEIIAGLVSERRLAMINPFTALLHQNKMLQALIWAAQDETWLTPEMQDTIKSYLLPSYEHEARFVSARQSYVIKPAFGREGGGVRIVHASEEGSSEIPKSVPAEFVLASGGLSDEFFAGETYPSLYQRFVDLPRQRVRTVNGMEDTYLLLGCFCIAGRGSALGFRAGGMITDNRSYYLPVALSGGFQTEKSYNY